MPAIKALAEFMVEEEFGIKSSQTIWREHLYELNGFKEAIGEELLGLFLEGYEFNKDCDNIFALIENKLPRISVRLRNEEEQPFENLVPIVAGKKDKTIILSCQSEKVPLEVLIGLDFGEERLVFYPLDGFNVNDNGTAESAKHAAESNRFIGRLFANGVFEVWETGGKLLGRKDPYLPVNIMPDKTYQNYFNRAKGFEEIYEKRKIKIYNKRTRKLNKRFLLSSTYLSRKRRILF